MLFELVLIIVLNISWVLLLKFDPTPLYSIDGVVILNYIVTLVIMKKLPLASAFITMMSLLVTLLGFILIKGFIAPY